MAVNGLDVDWPDILALVIYFLVVLGVGFWATCRMNAGTSQGYFLAGRSMNWLLIGASTFSTNIGAPMFVGLAGSAAATGIAVTMFEWQSMLMLVALGWIFFPVYRACGCSTMPEYLRLRFGGTRIPFLLSIVQILNTVIATISGQMYAGALFIQQIFKLDLYLSVGLILVVTAAYTVIGGLTAVMWTDAVQALILVIGSFILAAIALIKVGSYETMKTLYMQSAANYTLEDIALHGNASNYSCGMPDPNAFHIFRPATDAGYPWPGMIFGLTILATSAWCTDQICVQRSLAAKNVSHAKGGVLLAAYLKILPFLFFVIPGLVSRVLFPNEIACAHPDLCKEICGNPAGCSNIAYPLLVINILPQGLRGIMLAALISALMSSLTSYFNSCSTIFTLDVYKRLRKLASERELMVVGRITTLIMAGISFAWLPILESVQGTRFWDYSQSIYSHILPPIVMTFWLGIFWKRTTEKAAFWTIAICVAIGLVRMSVTWLRESPACGSGLPDTRWPILSKVHYLHFAMISAAVAVILLVVISLCTEPRSQNKLRRVTYWTKDDPEPQEGSSDSEPESEHALKEQEETPTFDTSDPTPDVEVLHGRCTKAFLQQYFCGIGNKRRMASKQEMIALQKEMTSIAEEPKIKSCLDANAVLCMMDLALDHRPSDVYLAVLNGCPHVMRERVVRMFQHAYNGYLEYAYPYDELRPLTCDGHDTWGSYSLTLIDALDTLAVMGNYSEFRRVADLLITTIDFDRDINVSVFETNIRIVGGLLSAHLLTQRAGMELEAGWPCTGPLLRLSEKVARRILPAFNTSTGMPYGTVNLLHGVPKGETSVTCTAGVGTFIIEFGALSKLTGDPVFEQTAQKAMEALWKLKSPLGLVGNHIDVVSGKWTAIDAGIGAGVDSYFEYLVKGSILFQNPDLVSMFHEYRESIDKYLKKEDWYMWANMNKGSVTLPVFQSLDAFWPGMLSLLGDLDQGMKTLHNYHQIWKQYGATPEFYNIPKADVHGGREGYPLRPELIESTMYLYRATKDPYLLQVAVDILEAIEHETRTKCGYATIKDVRDHRLENRMESFFLAETTKYLYLMFDTENFIHNTGAKGTVIDTPNGQCIIDAGGYVFNTEAHPIDSAALYCCSAERDEDLELLQDLHDNIDLLNLLGNHDDDYFTDPSASKKQSYKKPNVKPKHHDNVNLKRKPKPNDDVKVVEINPTQKKLPTIQTIKVADVQQTQILDTDAIIKIISKTFNLAQTEEATTDKVEVTETGESTEGETDNGNSQFIESDTETGPPESVEIETDTSSDCEDEECECEAVEVNEYRTKHIPKESENSQKDFEADEMEFYETRLLTCPAQPFHSRLSILGEMFINK